VVAGELRTRLLAIKKGEVALEEVLAMADAMTPELESARQETRLPRRPDVGRADALLRRIGQEVAARWTNQMPGVFGKDSPAAPVVEWKDEP
jgi:hypothetical protein